MFDTEMKTGSTILAKLAGCILIMSGWALPICYYLALPISPVDPIANLIIVPVCLAALALDVLGTFLLTEFLKDRLSRYLLTLLWVLAQCVAFVVTSFIIGFVHEWGSTPL